MTTLSGEIGAPADITDNSLHLIVGSGTDSTAALDGDTITAGNSNGTGVGVLVSQRGFGNPDLVGNAFEFVGFTSTASRPRPNVDPLGEEFLLWRADAALRQGEMDWSWRSSRASLAECPLDLGIGARSW